MLLVPLIFLVGHKLRFAKPFPVLANGVPINVSTGHAAPAYADFDGDGIPDLLVGQFDQGSARLYKNHGTAKSPKFREFKLLQAGAKPAAVDYG